MPSPNENAPFFSSTRVTLLATLLRYWEQIGLNAYLIALPIIAIAMGAETQAMKLIVSLFYFGYALACFLAGAIISFLGIRATLVISIAVFFIGTLICALSYDAVTLGLGRFLQSLSLGVLPVISKTMLSVMPPNKQSKVFNYSRVGVQLSGPIGMALTGFLLHRFPWQVIFIFMFFIALLSNGLLFFFGRKFVSTLSHRHRLSIKDYIILVKRYRFMAWILAYGLIFSIFNVYLLNATFLLVHTLHVDANSVGWIMSGIFLTTIIGLLIGANLQGRIANIKIIVLGLSLLLFGVLLLLLLAWLVPSAVMVTIILPLILCEIGIGIFYGPFNQQMLKHNCDIPSSYIMSFPDTSISLVTTITTFIAAFFHHLSLIPTGIEILIICLLAFTLIFTSMTPHSLAKI